MRLLQMYVAGNMLLGGWQDLDTDFSAESVKFEFGCPQWCGDFCNYVQMDDAGGGRRRRMGFNEVYICALQF